MFNHPKLPKYFYAVGVPIPIKIDGLLGPAPVLIQPDIIIGSFSEENIQANNIENNIDPKIIWLLEKKDQADNFARSRQIGGNLAESIAKPAVFKVQFLGKQIGAIKTTTVQIESRLSVFSTTRIKDLDDSFTTADAGDDKSSHIKTYVIEYREVNRDEVELLEATLQIDNREFTYSLGSKKSC